MRYSTTVSQQPNNAPEYPCADAQIDCGNPRCKSPYQDVFVEQKFPLMMCGYHDAAPVKFQRALGYFVPAMTVQHLFLYRRLTVFYDLGIPPEVCTNDY